MIQSSTIQAFSHGNEDSTWITAYSEACLSGKNPGTIDVYQRTLRDFLLWLMQRYGHTLFPLDQLTRTSVERYILTASAIPDLSSYLSTQHNFLNFFSSSCVCSFITYFMRRFYHGSTTT